MAICVIVKHTSSRVREHCLTAFRGCPDTRDNDVDICSSKHQLNYKDMPDVLSTCATFMGTSDYDSSRLLEISRCSPSVHIRTDSNLIQCRENEIKSQFGVCQGANNNRSCTHQSRISTQCFPRMSVWGCQSQNWTSSSSSSPM